MRRKIDLLILLFVLVVGGIGLTRAQQIGDWWHAQTYDPPTEIVQLADAAGMSDEGKKLFYRFEPSLVDQATLDEKCSAEKLGCTEGRFIYILKGATDQEEYNRAVVTAAHEMLHVAYSRLSESKKSEIKSLIDDEIATSAADGIARSLADYPAADYDDEAHSFVGSELAGIGSELEQYYRTYFSDRSKTTAAYAASPER